MAKKESKVKFRRRRRNKRRQDRGKGRRKEEKRGAGAWVKRRQGVSVKGKTSGYGEEWSRAGQNTIDNRQKKDW